MSTKLDRPDIIPHHPRSRNFQYPPPPPSPLEPQPSPQPPSPKEEEGQVRFNTEGVGKIIEDSTAVLNLSPHSITVQQVKLE